jgi:hypothetical protein
MYFSSFLEKGEMGETCAGVAQKRSAYRFCMGKTERNRLINSGVYRRITLKRILSKWYGKLWTGFI